jgi:hypothetical protein
MSTIGTGLRGETNGTVGVNAEPEHFFSTLFHLGMLAGSPRGFNSWKI